jgi:hypothetical protein
MPSATEPRASVDMLFNRRPRLPTRTERKLRHRQPGRICPNPMPLPAHQHLQRRNQSWIMAHDASRRSVAMNQHHQRISSLPQKTADIAAVILWSLILITARPAANVAAVDIQPIARERKQVQYGHRRNRGQINLPGEDAMQVRRRGLVLSLRGRGDTAGSPSAFNRYRHRCGTPYQPGRCQGRFLLLPSHGNSSRPRHDGRCSHCKATGDELSTFQGHPLFHLCEK